MGTNKMTQWRPAPSERLRAWQTGSLLLALLLIVGGAHTTQEGMHDTLPLHGQGAHANQTGVGGFNNVSRPPGVPTPRGLGTTGGIIIRATPSEVQVLM